MQRAAEEQRAYLRSVEDWLQSNNSILETFSNGLNETVNYYRTSNRVVIDLAEARSRVALSNADIASTRSALNAQLAAAQATIDAGVASSDATTAAGLAQAAYAIRSISANLTSASSDAESKAFASTATEGREYTRSFSYTKSLTATDP